MTEQDVISEPGRPALELEGISKGFPGVQALSDVSLRLHAGSIHALLGENGAGKSTLIKIIAGVYRPDSGRLRVDGREVGQWSPRRAFLSGISVVHQERSLIPTFTVGENVLLERVVGSGPRRIRQAKIHRDAEPFLQMVGLNIVPEADVRRLSPGQRQLVEIARALSAAARVLLLDEPTASISLDEARALLATTRRLRESGVAIIYVTHRLEEVFEVCDTVTVLRDGRSAGPTAPVAGLTTDDVVSRMVGRSPDHDALSAGRRAYSGVALEVVGLQAQSSPVPVSFTLREGEILGWYGLVGSGRTELARALIGADRSPGGRVIVDGQPARIRSVHEALHRWRIGYVSENRQEEGLFLMHSVARNIAATNWSRLTTRFGLLDGRREERLADRFRTELSIKTPSLTQTVGTLSGGNQQKVSIAKWLASQTRVILFDEPTVGIDVGTKFQIHRLIWGLAEQGVGVIVISSDMPEVVRLADRILVFRAGGIVGELQNDRVYAPMSRRIMDLIVAPRAPVAATRSEDRQRVHG